MPAGSCLVSCGVVGPDGVLCRVLRVGLCGLAVGLLSGVCDAPSPCRSMAPSQWWYAAGCGLQQAWGPRVVAAPSLLTPSRGRSSPSDRAACGARGRGSRVLVDAVGELEFAGAVVGVPGCRSGPGVVRCSLPAAVALSSVDVVVRGRSGGADRRRPVRDGLRVSTRGRASGSHGCAPTSSRAPVQRGRPSERRGLLRSGLRGSRARRCSTGRGRPGSPRRVVGRPSLTRDDRGGGSRAWPSART